MKLNIHRFQKKSKLAWKNVGLFCAFFVPVHVAHFKSRRRPRTCNRLSKRTRNFSSKVYAFFPCLIWMATSHWRGSVTRFLKCRWHSVKKFAVRRRTVYSTSDTHFRKNWKLYVCQYLLLLLNRVFRFQSPIQSRECRYCILIIETFDSLFSVAKMLSSALSGSRSRCLININGTTLWLGLPSAIYIL